MRSIAVLSVDDDGSPILWTISTAQLIAALRADARTPVATLAERLGVSRGTVQNRIDRMMREGAILGFTLRLPPQTDAASGARHHGDRHRRASAAAR